jgi:hypothetical protein
MLGDPSSKDHGRGEDYRKLKKAEARGNGKSSRGGYLMPTTS